MTHEQPEPPDRSDDFDRRFEELVANWHEPSGEPAGESAEPAGPDAEPAPPAPFTVPDQWRAGTGPSVVDQQEPDFEPPEPPPLPSDEGFWITLGALVVGPLWLLYLYFFDRYAAALWWVLAVGVFMAGLVMMVLRQPANRDDEDPFDDGARL